MSNQKPEPNIQLGDMGLRAIHLDAVDVWRSGSDGKRVPHQALVIEIRNEPSESDVGYADVKVHLKFRGPNGNEYRAAPCAWIGEPYNTVRINPGLSKWIVAAVQYPSDWRIVTNVRGDELHPHNQTAMEIIQLPSTKDYCPLEIVVICSKSGRKLRNFHCQWKWELGQTPFVKPMSAEDTQESRADNPDEANNSEGKPSNSVDLLPVRILSSAIRAVPAVRYALGIAGIVSVIAIVQALHVDIKIAAWGTAVMLILMALLVLFARLTTVAPSYFLKPALVFTWSVLVLMISTAVLMLSSVFFRFPADLQNWISSNPQISERGLRLLKVAGEGQIIPLGSYRNFEVKVVNANGNPVQGAKVMWQDPDMGPTAYVAVSNSEGIASATNLYTSQTPSSFVQTAKVVSDATSRGFVQAGQTVGAGPSVEFNFKFQ